MWHQQWPLSRASWWHGASSSRPQQQCPDITQPHNTSNFISQWHISNLFKSTPMQGQRFILTGRVRPIYTIHVKFTNTQITIQINKHDRTEKLLKRKKLLRKIKTFLCCFRYMAVQVSLEGFNRLWKYLLHFEFAKRNT